MKKIISLTAIFLFASAAFAQTTVNSDKNSVLFTKNNTVEITAVAIPSDQKESLEITPENYHQNVEINNHKIENSKSVDITVEATKYGGQNKSFIKKEAISVGKTGEVISQKSNQKQVERTVEAVKQ